MESNDENFFENLANGGAVADAVHPGGEGEEEAYEVKLAKASASAMATRNKSGAATQKEMVWDDNEPEGQLTVDVYQTPEDIVVESAIAGVKPEDIDVNVTTDSISIRGARHHEKEVKDDDYLYQECYWGRFARSIILPQEIDPESAEVTFKNGILTIRLPKSMKKKTKKLKVRID